MLRHSIRRLNTALKENPCDYYDYVIKIPDNIKLPPKPNLPKDLKNEPQLAENSGSICSECFGSGWVTDTKNELDFGFNFKLTICKKCKGTGFVP